MVVVALIVNDTAEGFVIVPVPAVPAPPPDAVAVPKVTARRFEPE
jgi:hypothetical protein